MRFGKWFAVKDKQRVVRFEDIFQVFCFVKNIYGKT